MLNWINKLIKHPVMSGVVVMLLGVFGTSVLGWWPHVVSFIKSIWLVLVSSIPVPVWLLVPISLVTIFVLFAVARNIFSVAQSGPPWKRYTEDVVYDIKWRWGYYSDDGLKDPVPFCPNYDFQLEPQFASGYSAIDRWAFQCENCGRNVRVVEEALDSFIYRVKRQIQLRMRNGDWKKVVDDT